MIMHLFDGSHIERVDRFVGDLQKLRKAHALLEEILAYYDDYSMEFQFQPEKEFQKSLKRMTPENQARAKTQQERLSEKIREYVDLNYTD